MVPLTPPATGGPWALVWNNQTNWWDWANLGGGLASSLPKQSKK